MNENHSLLLVILGIISLVSMLSIFLFAHFSLTISDNNKYRKKWLLWLIDICESIIIISSCASFILIPFIQMFQSTNFIYINFFSVSILLLAGIFISKRLFYLISISIAGLLVLLCIFINSNLSNVIVNCTIQFGFLILVTLYIYIANIGKWNQTIGMIIFSGFLLGLELIINIFCFQSSPFFLVGIVIICISFPIQIIFFLITKLTVEINKNTRYLNKSKKYEKWYFYNYANALKIIRNKISSGNIKYGLVIIFDYTNNKRLPILWGNAATRYINNSINYELINAFKDEDAIFFITNENEYACFLNLKNKHFKNLNSIYKNGTKQIRPSTDPLCDLQIKMLNIPRLISYKNKQQKISAGAYASIYGIHSCDIDNLLRLSRFTRSKSISKKGGIILDVYNPDNAIEWTPFKVETSLYQYFSPTELNIQLFQENLNDVIHYYFQVTCINKLLISYDEIKIYAQNKNIYIGVCRLIAMQCLKSIATKVRNWQNKYINIFYPISYLLSNKFSLHEFKDKINYLNIPINNLIIELDLNELDQNIDSNFEVLKDLRKHECQIKLINFQAKHLELIAKIQPNYIVLYKNDPLIAQEKYLRDICAPFNIHIS